MACLEKELPRRPAFTDRSGIEEAAPSAGLRVHTEKIVCEPDGSTISLQVIRPDTDDTLPCVYYIHGGGMATLSCYAGWGRLIAANGVAVVMADFRARCCRRRCPRSPRSRPGSVTAPPG